MTPESTWSATWRAVIALTLIMLALPWRLLLALWDAPKAIAAYLWAVWQAIRTPGAVTVFGRPTRRGRNRSAASTIALILALLSAPSLAGVVNVRIEDANNPPGALTYVLYRLDGAAWVPAGEVSRSPAGNVSVGTVELPTGRYRLRATARWGAGTNALESATGPEATATVSPLAPTNLEVTP
jgi:hypothetical protein